MQQLGDTPTANAINKRSDPMASTPKHAHQDLLAQLQTQLQRFCQTQANTYITAASEYLFQQADQASRGDSQQRFIEARNAVQAQRESLPTQLEKSINDKFERLLSGKKPRARKATAQDEEELSLLDDSSMELKVAITSMSHRAEADCAEPLFALTQRAAVLNKGVKLEEYNNPFAPELFCNALADLLEALELELPTQLILLKLFERYFIKNLGMAYGELNQSMVEANILPNLRQRGASRRPIEPRRRRSDFHSEESDQRQVELFETIQSLLAASPRPVNPSLPVLPIDQIISQLNALQSQQINAFQEASFSAAPAPQVANSETQTHQQAIECVGIVFEHILDDKSLPDSVKSLLSHLHTPLLKLALIDKGFLSDPQHIARQLVNNMVGAGERWVSTEDEQPNDVFERMREMVKRIISEFNHDASALADGDGIDTSLLDDLNEELSAHCEKLERRAEVTEQRSIEAARGKETLQEGRNKVDQLIQDKLRDEPLPKPIIKLVSEPWAAFLAYTLLRHGEDSQPWKDAVSVIDNLLWFIEPKVDEQEIKLAQSMQEDLREALEHGLSSVGMQPNEIAQQVNAVFMCMQLATENAADPSEAPHAAATVASEATHDRDASHDSVATHDGATAHDSEASDGNTREVVDVEADLSAQAAEHAADSDAGTSPAAAEQNQASTQPEQRVKRPPNVTAAHLANQADSVAESAELIRLSDIAGKPKTEHNEQASQAQIDAVLSLDFGTWLDWAKPGEPARRLKLTWYNRNTQNCMLSNQMGQQVAVVAANEIALGISQGWIRIRDVAERRPFFERMFETVVDQLKLRSKSA